MDIFTKCATDEGYFGPQRHAGDHYFTRPELEPIPGPKMNFQGKETIMWSVNNYLGLAGNEEIKQTAAKALDEFSVSAPMGSRMMSGNTRFHKALEQRLADFEQKESAFLFNYGYLGVIGTIASLIGKDDIIIMDKLAHASIVDGVFLSGGTVRVFRHNNMDSLETTLKRVNRDRKGGILVVTEGTYGMTGDLAKLDEICALKDKYDARLFIDDAHGIGVIGEKGRGTADHFGVQDKVDLYFGTFAKSFASIGGFTACRKDVRDWILYNARTQVFAKSLPMVYVKSLDKTLDFVMNGDDRRQKMWDNAKLLKDGLRNLGYHIGTGESPITSVFLPVGEDKTPAEVGMATVKYLRDRGIFVTGITYPVIPLGLIMYRMIPTAAHSIEEIDTTVNVFKEMRDEMNLSLTITGEVAKNIQKIYGE